MSQENVELATQVLDAIAQFDFPRMIAMTDPEVEWKSFFALGEEGVYRGHDGMGRYANDVKDAWDVLRPEIDGAIEVADVALLVGRLRYRGKGSGVETESRAGWMFKFRNGRVLIFRAFREPERVFEAVGLWEQDARADS
jgi:ketosteroid isomerase-like protein